MEKKVFANVSTLYILCVIPSLGKLTKNENKRFSSKEGNRYELASKAGKASIDQFLCTCVGDPFSVIASN
jgi:hypothetical protein